MKKIFHFTEQGLGDYVLALVGRTYRRQLDRFFEGTVTAVAPLAAPTAYLVQISRVGDLAAGVVQTDGNTYACNVPGYVPAVGDRVQLEWIHAPRAEPTRGDGGIGVVIGPIGPGKHYSTAPGVTAVAASSGLSIVGSDRRGRVIFTNTNLQAAGVVLLTVTFAAAWPTQPFVVCSESSGHGAVIDPDYATSDATKFQVVAGQGGLAAATQYAFDYHVEQ